MSPQRTPHRAQPAETSPRAVAQVQAVDAKHLRRPGRYWTLLGTILAALAVNPLAIHHFVEPWRYLAVPLFILIVAFLFLWREPSAKRRYRMDGLMVLQLLPFALVCGVLVGVSTWLYETYVAWWIPACIAVLIFFVGTVGGRRLDRTWAHRMSHDG